MGERGGVDEEMMGLLELVAASMGIVAWVAVGGVVSRGDRILTLAAPGVAAAEAFQAEPKSAYTAVGSDRVEAIVRTTRGKPAAGRRASQPMEWRRQNDLVKPQQADEHGFHEGGSGGEGVVGRVG